MKKGISLILIATLALSLMAGCGKKDDVADSNTSAVTETEETSEESLEALSEDEAEEVDAAFTVDADMPYWMTAAESPVALNDIPCIGQMTFDYAQFVNVYYYEGGYKVISITDYDTYLIVPEGAEVPETDLIVLQQPLDKIYLQATAVMALFRALDGLSNIRFVGTQASGWSIEEAVDAIERGDMIFAGKYSEPDYETLVEHEANLAIESTMILHSPKVKEILESLDIPVFVEYSAYEPEALGRTEWVKVYAAMLNIEEKAFDFFDEQEEVIKMVEDCEKSDKTVVYFYIGTEGTAIVPNDNTYTIGMIRTAGGNYVFDGLHESFDSPTVALSMEEFYAKAIDADYIIYNSSIDSSLASIDELLTKSSLLADFKAVKEGNVWCTGKSLFQSTDRLAYMILDIYNMLNGADADEMTFLQKIE